MNIKRIITIVAIVVAAPIIIGCEDGGVAFDALGNETPNPNDQAYTYVEDGITDLACDVNTPCPEELECWAISNVGTQCVDPDPDLWYCEEGTEATVAESDPPQLVCAVTGDGEGGGDGEGEGEADYEYVGEHITDLSCDATTVCPDALECWGFEGFTGSFCVDPNPSDWYCAEGEEAIISASNPPLISCVEEEDNITDTVCTADADCAMGETCWIMPGLGARCVAGNPMSWYDCGDDDYFPVKFIGSPPALHCMTIVGS